MLSYAFVTNKLNVGVLVHFNQKKKPYLMTYL